MTTHSITVAAPINIAFIKYWGKRAGGEELILPTNDSFSITLATEPFRSLTTAVLSDKITEDSLLLNDEPVDVQANKRLANVLQIVRATSPADRAQLKVMLVSNNNFPTAAGMASSPSGFCALATALSKVFQSTADVSILARIGSGSACRSVYGGFVKWNKGVQENGDDCKATQFVAREHWPEMNVLCAVVKGMKKDVSSTKGMQLSVENSPLMPTRIESVVPERMEAVSKAIVERDFESFATITMHDSDDLQHVCRTTEPPIVYPTDDSYALIRLVHAYNREKQRKALAYTFDAGANCFMFTLEKDLPEVIAVIRHHFPTNDDLMKFHSPEFLSKSAEVKLPSNLQHLIGNYPKKSLTYLLQSPVGPGPVIMNETEALIDVETLTVKQ